MGKSMTSMMTGLAVIFIAGLSVGWAQEATVKLLSPKDGEVTVSGSAAPTTPLSAPRRSGVY
jgi:hypothetical protein